MPSSTDSPTFRNFVCWEPESPTDVINVDAPALKRAVFLAVHHERPLHYLRFNEFADGAAGSVTGQADLLEHFANKPAPEVMFVAILGRSGSGKSHLVKWVRHELARISVDQDRLVYLDKTGMTLQRLIELSIEGLESPDLTVIRENIAKQRRDVSVDDASSLLVQYLAIALQRDKPQLPDTDAIFMRDITSLLRDQAVADALANDSEVKGFAEGLVTGVAPDAERFEFRESMLNFKASVAAGAGKAGKDALGTRLAVKSSRQKTCQLLNHILPSAVRELIGLGQVDLGELFRRVRQLLQRENQRLLLLIEDLAVISGVEEEFADAITVPSTEDNQLCEIRVLAASTEEPFRRSKFMTKDTILSRILSSGGVYQVDQFVADQQPGDRAAFVGRYMNAVRLGATRLEGTLSQSKTVMGSTWIPNACEECRFQVPCHDLFGSTDLGHGLYPFDNTSMARIQDLIGPMFDPRRLLSGIRDVLSEHHADLAVGSFPPGNLEAEFRDEPVADIEYLDEASRSAIRSRYPEDAERIIEFHEFWLDPADGLRSRAIADVFGLPGDILDQGGAVGPNKVATPKADREQPTEHPLESLLNDWGRPTSEKVLDSAVAGELRQLVIHHIQNYLASSQDLHFSQKWVSPGPGRYINLGSIDLGPRAAGGGGYPGILKIDIRPDQSENVQFLLALLRFEHHGTWEFSSGTHLRLIYQSRMDQISRDINHVALYESVGQLNTDYRNSLVKHLALSVLALGELGAVTSDSANEIASILRPDLSAERRDSLRSLQQVALKGDRGWERNTSREELLHRYGVRQGAGAAWRAVDAVEIAAALEDLDLNDLSTPASVPSDLKAALSSLNREIGRAIKRTNPPIRERREIVDQIKRLDIDLTDPEELVRAMSAFVDRAAEAQFLAGITRLEWRDIADSIEPQDFDKYFMADTQLADLEQRTPIEVLQFLAQDINPSLRRIEDLCMAITKAYESTEKLLRSQATGNGGETPLDYSTVLEDLADRISKLGTSRRR